MSATDHEDTRMTDLPPYPDAQSDLGGKAETDRKRVPARTVPLWLFIVAIVAAAALIVLLHHSGIMGPGLHR